MVDAGHGGDRDGHSGCDGVRNHHDDPDRRKRGARTDWTTGGDLGCRWDHAHPGLPIQCTETGTENAQYATGINTLTYNANLDDDTGRGVTWGTTNLALTAFPDSGFAGEWTNKQSMTQGYGDFVGCFQRVSLEQGSWSGVMWCAGDK